MTKLKCVDGVSWHTGEELYDLENDSIETTNLADKPTHAGILETMRTKLGAVETIAASKKRQVSTAN